ncbi:disease resistance protein RPP4-like isoform X2 [Prosopis cineraria]|nr:disease resistance protein RPP4-like isoform X2 [Prosopis cineraria]XP_054780088.1 disease resistance protein RPP4-like isoform X2 [Prosopis cineraria]
MEDSNIKKLWDGVQDLVNLKTLSLPGCKQLVELPNFSMALNLKTVDLQGCESLHSVHPSILSLQSLVRLDVFNCRKLESLESETHLKSLSYLSVQHCLSLEKFCLSSKKLGSLRFRATGVKILHLLSMGGFTELRELAIENGKRLRSLPISELCGLTNLRKFELYNFQQVIHTTELRSLFDAWDDLEELVLHRCNYLLEIPDNIQATTSLKRMFLRDCKRLKSILGFPPFLQELDAGGCTSLEIVYADSLVQNQCRFHFDECIKLDERSLQFIEELTHFSLTLSCEHPWFCRLSACYPGIRVPKWIEYKHQTEASNAIEFICNLERSPTILCCCVVPTHLYLPFVRRIYCDFSYDDNNKFRSAVSYFSTAKMELARVYIWHMDLEDVSFGAGTGDVAKISCEFYADYNDGVDFFDGEVETVPMKACGVHVTYNSQSDSGEERLRPTFNPYVLWVRTRWN